MTFTQTQFAARLDARSNAPRIVAWTDECATIEWPTLDAAVANARAGTDYIEDGGPRAAWDQYIQNHQDDDRWNGGVTTADAWDRVVSKPPAKLAARVRECMDALDAVPLPLDEAPRRRSMRNLDEGDAFDPIRMVEDLNLDRAWSERRRHNRPRPFVRVVLNSGLNCNLDAKALAWRGACAMAIARRAEDAGADVELIAAVNWRAIAADTRRSLVMAWPLKARGEFADRDTLTAYCCHFAAFRWFAWVLAAQNMQGSRVCYSWGSMGRIEEVTAHLKADVVVDYDVITKDRAVERLRQVAELVEARR